MSNSGSIPGYTNGPSFSQLFLWRVHFLLTRRTAIQGTTYYRPISSLLNVTAADSLRMATDVAVSFPAE